MQRVDASELGDLYQQPFLATLATYRKDGTALLSPVWFEWDDPHFLVSLVHGDWKELHLRRNPLAGLLIAEEANYPGRALEVSGKATVTPDVGGVLITRIATRYLGEEIANQWLEPLMDFEWDVMRLVPERTRALDHRNVPYLARCEPQYPPTSEWRVTMTRMPKE